MGRRIRSNKVDLFTAMFDRIRLPMETMTERCREKDPDNDPLGTLRKIFILVLRETVRNPHRRRVLDILFHKCEYTEELGPVMRRDQDARADGREHMERSLRSPVAPGQLSADPETRRAPAEWHHAPNRHS